MLSGLYYAHSGLRWLVVLAAIAALGFMVYSLVTQREKDRATRIIMVVFSSLVGVQWVLGMIYYTVIGTTFDNWDLRNQPLHALWMTGALIVAHLYMPFRRRASNRVYYTISTVVVAATLVVIFLGVNSLVGGNRWSLVPMNVLGG